MSATASLVTEVGGALKAEFATREAPMSYSNFQLGKLIAAGAVALSALSLVPASAATITVVDNSDISDPTAFVTGITPISSTTTKEGVGTLGTYNLLGEWHSASPLAPGAVRTFAYNMGLGENGPGTTSDTASITLIGLISTTADTPNMLVSLSFSSDSLDEAVLPVPLAGGVASPENLTLSDIAGTGLNISLLSAPGTVPGAGYLGLLGLALGAAALKLRERLAC